MPYPENQPAPMPQPQRPNPSMMPSFLPELVAIRPPRTEEPAVPNQERLRLVRPVKGCDDLLRDFTEEASWKLGSKGGIQHPSVTILTPPSYTRMVSSLESADFVPDPRTMGERIVERFGDTATYEHRKTGFFTAYASAPKHNTIRVGVQFRSPSGGHILGTRIANERTRALTLLNDIGQSGKRPTSCDRSIRIPLFSIPKTTQGRDNLKETLQGLLKEADLAFGSEVELVLGGILSIISS